MKVLLIAGHDAGDPGAPGCGYKEANPTRELVNLIAPKLRRYVTVDVYNQDRGAFYDMQNGTFKINKYDYVLEAHFNAFNGSGHGAEAFITDSEKCIDAEQAIMNRLGEHSAKCGGSGIRVANWLVIYTCKCLGISPALLEARFIGNKADMVKYQANRESIAQGIVDGITEGFQLKVNSAEQRSGNKPVKHKKPSKPAEPRQSDQVLHKGEYFVITEVHSVDQVLVNVDSTRCEEMIGNGGNSIQVGPLTKCNKSGEKTKSQIFSVGDYRRCDKKFRTLAIDIPANSVQANVGGRKIWPYTGLLHEV